MGSYDAWLEAPYQRQFTEQRREGDTEDLGEIVTVGPCATCGKPCAVVERVVSVWSFDFDEDSSRGGMRSDEEKHLDEEKTTVRNPDAPASEWECVVCCGFADEDDISRPEVQS